MPHLVKEMMLKEISAQFEANPYAFISSFDGLSVADISDFRRSLNKVSKRSLLVKHSLAKKVFASRKIADAEKFLKGSVVVTFGSTDPQPISKAIMEYVKTHEKWAPQGVILENKVYDQEFVKRLAKLPTRHELLTQVAMRVKSPITGLVLTLNQLVRGLAVAINEIKKKKEGLAAA